MDGLRLLVDARVAGLTVRATADGQLLIRGPRRRAALAEALLARKREMLVALELEPVLALCPGARIVAGLQRAVWPPRGGWLATTAPAIDVYAATAPAAPCRSCGGATWHRAGTGWSCGICHPAPVAAEGRLAPAGRRDADAGDRARGVSGSRHRPRAFPREGQLSLGRTERVRAGTLS